MLEFGRIRKNTPILLFISILCDQNIITINKTPPEISIADQVGNLSKLEK